VPSPQPINGAGNTTKAKDEESVPNSSSPRPWIISIIAVPIFVLVTFWQDRRDQRLKEEEEEAKIVCDAPRAPESASELASVVETPEQAVVRDG